MSDEPQLEGAEVGVTTVTEEDESNNTTDPKLSYEDAAAENARAQAEARRKRILEKADKRLGVVSGEQPILEVEKTSSASNAARIRAARARRYGKKGATDAKATPEIPTPAATETTTSISDTGDATEAAPPGVQETSPDPVNTPAKLVPDTKPESTTETPVATDTEADQVASGKKKYQGVAKMRRKMIAQKKMEEAEGTSTDAATNATVAANVVGLPKKVAVFPVYMHIVTVLLLFVAGFDVGVQQFHEDIQIHTQSAIKEYGIPFVHRKPWQPLAPIVSVAFEEEYLSEHPNKDQDSFINADEFHDIAVEEYVPNIDPIFGVDLDELTKGPGVLNQLARGAIALHRMILWAVYYTPLSIFNSLISIPMAFIQMPPVLFVIAVLLRQVVGKALLRADIPEPSDGNSDGSGNIEVISMAKNFIKNFMATTFPTLVTLYDAFTHLRSDMYIVLCGVFCGLVWTHLYTPGLHLTAAEGGTDEL